MTDLTAIKTPFGLLDRETQEALKAHAGEGASTWEGDARNAYKVADAMLAARNPTPTNQGE